MRAEAVKRRQCAARGDFEERATTVTAAERQIGTASLQCPVEVPTGGLHQREAERKGTVAAVEAQQRSQRAAYGDFEDRPVAVGSALIRCPVEFPIRGLDKPIGRVAVGVVEAADCCESLGRRDNRCRYAQEKQSTG